MKITVIYASAGTGHFKAAQAIYNCFKKNNPEFELKLIDALDKSNFLFRNIYTHGYSFLINYAIYLWSIGFRVTYSRHLLPILNWIKLIINLWNTKGLTKLLIHENPNLIISTHFLPSEIAAFLKKNQKINSKLISVITDFGLHPFWLYANTDLYVAASDFTKQLLVAEGIKEGKIKVLGIPIDTKFVIKPKENYLYTKFNLVPDMFTVLIVTGSFGIGPIEETVDLLYRDVQILVVCAKNRRLSLRLKYKSYPNVRVFGFVDNIEELMAVSDVIITKPGGLTVSEVLAMELAPIFISAIPGQEAENAKILEKYGIGLTVKNISDLRDIILDYKVNSGRLNKIKENIRRIKKPSAVQELYNVVCQGSIGDTC